MCSCERLSEYQQKVTSEKGSLTKISVWLDTPSASFVIISAYDVVIRVNPGAKHGSLSARLSCHNILGPQPRRHSAPEVMSS
jgi:hypothetical protein